MASPPKFRLLSDIRIATKLAVISGLSILLVAGIVGDIANASAEQATGLDQINKALTQMDEVTQQNSALVEENAATAKTLEQQARAMDAQVAFFKVCTMAGSTSASAPSKTAETPVVKPKPVSPRSTKGVPAPKPVGANDRERQPAKRPQTAGATALKADDWEEF